METSIRYAVNYLQRVPGGWSFNGYSYFVLFSFICSVRSLGRQKKLRRDLFHDLDIDLSNL